VRHFFHEQTRIRIRQAVEGYPKASIQGRNQAQNAPAGRGKEEAVEGMKTYKNKQSEASSLWYYKNIEKRKATSKNWRKQNPQKQHDRIMLWRKNNYERYLELAKLSHRKERATLNGKLNNKMGWHIWRTLHGHKRGRSWQSILGYTINDLKRHLESLFVEGMSWNNFGEWHIDHIIPKSFFQYEKPEDVEFQYCWSLDNLQPLWAIDNQIKSNQITGRFV